MNTSIKYQHLLHINCAENMHYRNSVKGDRWAKMSYHVYFHRWLGNREDIPGF